MTRLASCLADAYAAGTFRLEVEDVGRGARIAALGMGGLAPWRRRPRLEIDVIDTGRGTAEVALRTAPTPLGPEAEWPGYGAASTRRPGAHFEVLLAPRGRASAPCPSRWAGAIPPPEPPRGAAAL